MAAPDTRRSPRLEDLHATLRASCRGVQRTPVADLSQGGMAVEPAPQVEPDELVRFELSGPGFQWSGTARVAHVDADRVGLEFVRWDGPAHRALRALLERRFGDAGPRG